MLQKILAMIDLNLIFVKILGQIVFISRAKRRQK